MVLFTTKRKVGFFSFLAGLIPALLCLSNIASAQFANVPVTGFNADIVADGTSGTTPGASSTAPVDGATNGYVFVDTTFGFSGTRCANIVLANALPPNNQITSTNTTTNTGITYQLQGYGNGATTNNNALRIVTGGTGTLTLVTPVNAAKLYLVCLGGGGASSFNATINYSDGTSEVVTNPSGGAPDWCSSTANTYKLTTQQYFRLNRTATACNGDGGNCQYLYEIPVAISGANYAKNIISVSFSSVTTGLLNILALGMQASCTPPPAPTGITFGASTASTVNGSFTASAATGYLVVSYPAGSTPVTPVSGTTYVSGAPLGAGKIVSMGATTTFSANTLSANTSYDIYVYAYNAPTTCGGPVFSTALMGTQATLACGAPTIGTVNAGVRTITVGPTGDAATITAALTNINTNGMNTPTILELQSNYVSSGETYPIVFPLSPCFGSINTLTLRPALNANGLSIVGTNAGPTIDFNGASYVIIDGRPGGNGNSITTTAAGSLNTTNLNITNTNAAGAAIKLDNNANNNLIKYCDIQGQNTVSAGNSSTIGGVVYIENTGSNGNDNNTFSYCNIHSSSASAFPAMGIYSLGTNITTGYALTSNDNNTVDNCNIYDYFNATSGTNSTGIELNYGNNAWIITNNSFYQTASRAVTAAYNRAIWLIPYRAAGNVGNGFNISNNYIGGSQPQCGGGAYTLTTSGYFDGIRVEIADGATPNASIIQNNVIKNISITSTSTSDLFHGIAVTGGTSRINIIGNVIGTPTGTGGATTNGITLTANGTGTGLVAGHAIILTGAGIDSVINNVVANITIGGSNVSNFTGLFSNTGLTSVINNNTFGSLTDPQSINLSSTVATSSTTGKYLCGIRIQPSAVSNFTIKNNIIAGLSSSIVYTGNSSQVVGISIASSTANISNGVTGNQVRNLYNAGRSTGAGANSSLIGIMASNGTNTSFICNVSNNVIDSLVSGAASGTVNVIGLYATGATNATNIFNNNLIHSIIAPVDASAVIDGIYFDGGTSTYSNNMIRLGINPDGTDYTNTTAIYGINGNTTSATNLYYNSVYIGGNNVGTTATNTYAFRRTVTSGTYNVMNNIFVNNRSNATTGGSHYAVYFTTANTGASLNKNLFNTAGTGGVFGYSGTANVATYSPGWITADAGGYAGNPQFINAIGSASTVNLHLNTSVASLAESHGVAVTSVTSDFDGDSRSGYSGSASGSAPDIGADEFAGIYINTTCTGTPAIGVLSAPAGGFLNSAVNLAVTGNPNQSVDGIVVQWQQSATGLPGGWTNFTGNNYTASPTLTASTYFRYYMSCTASGLSDTSNVKYVIGYCTVTYNNGSCVGPNGISNVTLGTINNSPTVCSSPTDFTNLSTNITAGVTNNISITTSGYVGVKVAADLNNDGDFTDVDELLIPEDYLGATVTATHALTFVVPGSTPAGSYRLRIWSSGGNASANTTPCGAQPGYGTFNDYTINVLSAPPCAGTLTPGNTNPMVPAFCFSGSTKLTLDNSYVTSSGIVYQWQKFDNPSGTWMNIASANGVTYTTPIITQTTQYRCHLTCTGGGTDAYSNPGTVTINALPPVVVNPTSDAFCTSSALTASGAITYAWAPNTNLDVTTGSVVNANPTTTTTYTVTGTDGNGCVNTASTTVIPMLSLTPTATAQNTCTANVPVSIQVTPVATSLGSMEYKLTDTAGTVITNWQAGTTFSVTPTTEGKKTYYVFARNTTCNTVISDTGTVVVYAGFSANVVSTNASCANGDGSLAIVGSTGPAGGGSPTAVWYSNDFGTSTLDTNAAALRGVATILTGYLQLTPNTTSKNGGFLIKNPASISRFDSVAFNLSVAQSGADGLSWSYGDNVIYSNSNGSYENGVGDKLIVSFDAFGTANAAGAPGIYLMYGQNNNASTGLTQAITSTMLAYSTNVSWVNALSTHTTIFISQDNKLTLKVGANVIFDAVQLPAAYASANRSTWQQLIAARTGGISEEHYIDNLGIYYNATSYVYGSSPAHSGTMPTSWQVSNTFSGLSGGDSLDLWVANPSSPATCNKLLGTYGVGSPMMTSNLGSIDPSCIGLQDGYQLLKVPTAGTYSISYNKNGGSIVTQSGVVSGNDGTNEYVFALLGAGTYTNFKVINATGCVSNTIAGPITLNAPMPATIATTTSSSGAMTQTGAGTQYYTDASCNIIAGITSPNNLGSVTSNVNIGAVTPPASGEPFVGRYYDIAPSQNNTMAATLKLYFTPSDFTAYNVLPSVGTATYPAIAADGSNLRIKAFHGTPASGTTGPNGMYNASNADLLQPTSVVSTNGYWEVTVYSPNGFSGFFANTNTSMPLNIKLGKISALNEGAINAVNWDTKSENAKDYFVIERSNDGKTFKYLATITAKGKAPSEYSFIDEKPINGINYYRLILMNEDGSKEYSKVVDATVRNGAAFKFNVFPNPVSNELNVTVTEITGKGIIEISDITGRVLLTKTVTGTTTNLTLNHLADGIYIVKYHDDAHSETIKVDKK